MQETVKMGISLARERAGISALMAPTCHDGTLPLLITSALDIIAHCDKILGFCLSRHCHCHLLLGQSTESIVILFWASLTLCDR